MENNQVFANKKAVSVAIQLNDCKAVVLSSTCLFSRWGRWHIPVKSRGFPLPPIVCVDWIVRAETVCFPGFCHFRMEYEYEKVFRKIFSGIPCRRLCVNANVIICQIKNCRLFFNSLTRILIDGIQMILIKFKEEEPSHYFLKKENCQDNVIFC